MSVLFTRSRDPRPRHGGVNSMKILLSPPFQSRTNGKLGHGSSESFKIWFSPIRHSRDERQTGPWQLWRPPLAGRHVGAQGFPDLPNRRLEWGQRTRDRSSQFRLEIVFTHVTLRHVTQSHMIFKHVKFRPRGFDHVEFWPSAFSL